MLYPGIVCDLTIPLYVTQKKYKAQSIEVMIHSLSNSRYLATNMLTSSYQGSSSFSELMRLPWVTYKVVW